MNKARKHEIEGSSANLRKVMHKIVCIRIDERDDSSDMKMTMQSYPGRQRSERAISSLTDVIAHINKAIYKLDNIQ